MNSNVRLHLSSLLTKYQGYTRPGRAFGREITNECVTTKQAAFFRNRSFVAEKRYKTQETTERERKPTVYQSPPTASNPQLTDYYEYICSYLAERELKRPHCDSTYVYGAQTEMTSKMRASVMDWLVDVHLGFKLLPQTLFKTTAIVDKYLSVVLTPLKKLQLVGTAALFIACKYEEIYPPATRSFVELVHKQYYLEDIIDMEGKILKALDFDLTFPTAATHLERLIDQYKLYAKDASFCWYLLELALLEHTFLKYSQSALATSVVFLMRVIYKKPIFAKVDYNCKACAKQLVLSLQMAPKYALQASRVKYSSKQFEEVSKLTVRPNTSNY